jgi:anti-sigma regulatory factor (Ser/Thr protein kinase)
MREDVQRQHLRIAQEFDVYSAAMLAYSLVQQAGARMLLATEAATVVSELGMNIVKYAGRGSLTLSLAGGARGYLEVVAHDHGPGIADLALALTDRFSSHGTLGLGLPGVRRVCNSFYLRSSPGHGTTVRARRDFDAPPGHDRAARAQRAPARPVAMPLDRMPCSVSPVPEWQHALARRPCFGEVVTGDGSVVQPLAQGLMVAILDVLGHGEQAHLLARRCERWLAAHAHANVVGVLEDLHHAIKGSVGTAITLAHLDATAGQMTVVGVGNTRLYTVGAPGVRIEAQPGIVGGTQLPRLRPSTVRISPRDVVVFTTDGIRGQLSAQDLQPLASHPVQHLAQQVLREHGHVYDDATCLVLRCPG